MADYKPLEEFDKDHAHGPKTIKDDKLLAELNTPEAGLTVEEVKFRYDRDG
jgi:hypothetical protein